MTWVNRILSITLLAAVVPLWRKAGEFPGTATTFPHVTLAVIALLAVVLLVNSFNRRHSESIERGEGERHPFAMLRPLAVFAVSAIGVYITRYIGFFAAMFAVSAVLYPLLSVTRPKVYVTAVLLLLAAVYVVFVVMLGVPLTGGRFWQS